ncbi:MAG: L-histidine N(alpha)-methyltransferase [Bacteroidetes bacterium]|nr:L-histidine N(alpha)-methyltransferase [Bacteroidota bacterium]
MKKTLEIFIASSLDYVNKSNGKIDVEQTNKGKLKPIIDGIRNAKFIPVPWWDTIKTFQEGNPFLSDLISASRKYDGGVFVFGKDLTDKVTGKGIPSLNVLMEAGMFYASKGIQRTFIVIDGDYDTSLLPSDIKGYSIAKLSDERDLEVKIKKFFRRSSEPEETKFDNITYYISEKHSENIKNCNYLSWRTKGQYIGSESARIWNKIEGNTSYDINVKELTKFLNRMIDEEKVDFKSIDNIVSLGCGNGRTDNSFLKRLKSINSAICYVPVDINPLMIYYASQIISKSIRMPFGIVSDFEEDMSHIKNIINGRKFEIGENNFFTMLGVTFSNLEGQEVDFFNEISELMDQNDYFLLDVSLYCKDDLDKLKGDIEDDNYKALLRNSLLVRELIPSIECIDDTKFEFKEIEDPTEISSYTDIDNTKVYCCEYKNEVLLISKRYNFDDIKKEIGDVFDLIPLKPVKGESVPPERVKSESGREKALFLFKMKEN